MIIRDPYDLAVSCLNRGVAFNMHRVLESLDVIDEQVEKHRAIPVSFRRMTTEPEYVLELAEKCGITDLERRAAETPRLNRVHTNPFTDLPVCLDFCRPRFDRFRERWEHLLK